jgi:hypothetical protein
VVDFAFGYGSGAIISYPQAVWFDKAKGKLFLVNSEQGRAFYRFLRDDGFSIEVIQRALMAACVKAPKTKAKDGGFEALVRSYCGYAAEREREQKARLTSPLPGRPAVPSSTFGGWE